MENEKLKCLTTEHKQAKKLAVAMVRRVKFGIVCRATVCCWFTSLKPNMMSQTVTTLTRPVRQQTEHRGPPKVRSCVMYNMSCWLQAWLSFLLPTETFLWDTQMEWSDVLTIKAQQSRHHQLSTESCFLGFQHIRLLEEKKCLSLNQVCWNSFWIQSFWTKYSDYD